MSEKTSNESVDKKRLRSIEDELESDEMMASSSSTVDESVDPLATGKYFHIYTTIPLPSQVSS